MQTFDTKYGKITLYKNERFIIEPFRNGGYWDEDTVLSLKKYIDPKRNILEIGGHCGTSSVLYSSLLEGDSKLYVYEPQQKLFNLLNQNIVQNNLQNRIISRNMGIFCYNGTGIMNHIDLDGGHGIVAKRYEEENHLSCNFGGIGLGGNGETISLTTIDSEGLDNIGFIHCDAQGSENFIFSKGIETITKSRPVILYEDNAGHNNILYKNVCSAYPDYKEESLFNLKEFCMETLHYSSYIEKFNGGIDALLIP
jgi:FkbM family methyltransferase